ncbi:calcium-activated chloride channel regulator 4 [Tribolium castaneum]|uniref:Calcium-activated chloride channel regulator 4-like Protein n=1 Tax=Tribolium castaneum TaxID=7070 RepID=D6WYH1_TRICA|nr:PREDICTED: calcium-activated chloride channel regulator 4 [Tribolium castaneum]EFA08980.2 Calcium-activated chloride channel regulator 4-like Protein [Tribolium castaneum]|eukprot:XP_973545.1 PREDICTED: calcium-activated chloride channel regulator 4 [Tribolium castaneum]
MERLFFGFLVVVLGQGLELKNGAYDDFVIKITEGVPRKDCRIVLDNLEETLTSASQYLFSALDSRAFLRSATVLLPPTWPDSCASSAVVSGSGETPDVTVLPRGPARGRVYTQQSLGCGEPGDQIYLAYESLMQRDASLARSLVKEFAKYRYGVFDEQGYYNDPIYPMCFYDDQNKQAKATGCSDLPISDNGICTSGASVAYNTSKMVDEKARSSIMFAAEAPQVSMFCDDGNHDRYAPTKHNSMCQRRSVLDVVLKHSDFSANSLINNVNSNQLIDTSIKITYKKQNLTRYVFVLESTKDMMQRESWSYLRLAFRYWASNILPDNAEVGMVLAEESSKKVLNIVSVKNSNKDENNNRDKFYSKIPYIPSDILRAGCLNCALKDAVEMLNDRTKTNGPANNVIVVIAAGIESFEEVNKTMEKVKKSKIKIATINYPTIMRANLLNRLAEETNGVSYTVFERKLNVDTTLLSTYFELQNVLYDIVKNFYSGSPSDLPIEIHRRQITDDGRSSITGSFMLDSTMGKPSQFTFFTHNSVTPLIKSIKLISPSHQVFAERNDRFIDFKMIGLTANISESGTWTYVVEPYPGNPQPHFLQVTATPISPTAPVVTARFWTHRNQDNGPLILLVEVKKGEIPVLGAKVEVTVTKPEINGSYPHKNSFELLDTGSGDPDVTKGDGVYTRYFNVGENGQGLYNFEVTVNDNGNTAYTWTESGEFDDNKPCCGSSISSPGVTPVSPFQRVLPKKTLMITSDDITAAEAISSGRIGDLRAQIIPEDMKARLTWTSPDLGGQTVTRYEIKYAASIPDITDGFETKSKEWDNAQPFPLPPGSETTYTLDMSQNRDLLDKPLYFAIKAYPKTWPEVGSPVSNWIRVLVPSPPPPPTVPPTYSTNDHPFWSNSNANSVGVDPVRPSIEKTMGVGLELILPIVIGFILLVILLIVYCYFCVIKRRDARNSHKKSTKNDKLSSTITIVPSSPQNVPQNQHYVTDLPDPHQIGVPIKDEYEEEQKKRYSLVNQQEQQLIEELKQQQMVHYQQRDLGTPNQGYQGLSVISNSTLNRNGHTLSPYNSWSASQLLHEHERRHSPMENMDDQVNTHQDLLMNPQADHMSQDHMSLNGHYPTQHHIPPPVPPLPAFNSNGYPVNYNIYGVHQGNNHMYQTRNEALGPFNPSLQGSLSSVNSGDKKRRNVTMV